MGYDCTLHLVDPNRIRNVLVPRLLGITDVRTAFDGRHDAPLVWEQARRSLAGDPAKAANLLCQLAVMWSSSELPHRYLRGIAFSLLDRSPIGPIPWHLADDPQSVFDAVLERHPALRGRFPTQFHSNYSTGFFISPERVPEAYAWLREQLDGLMPGVAAPYEPLARVLEVAAHRGLGFWEATDLGVDHVHPEWFDRDVQSVSLIDLPHVAHGWYAVGTKRFVQADAATGLGDALVWDGDLYEWADGEWADGVWARQPLGLEPSHVDWAPARTRDGAVWLLSNRALLRWHAGTLESVLPTEANVMSLAAGPGDCVAASFGDRDDGLAVGLVTPTGSVRGLRQAAFSPRETHVMGVAWHGHTLWVLTPTFVAGVPEGLLPRP